MRPLILVFIGLTFTSVEASSSSWSYHKQVDSLTDGKSSFSSSPLSGNRHGLRIGFECHNSRISFTFSSNQFIHSRREKFKLDYRVDKRPAQKLHMSTHSNAYSSGYTYDNVGEIAHNILGGDQIYVKATTWNGTTYEDFISLVGSDRNIKRIFNDCGQKTHSDVLKENKGLSDSFAQGATTLSCKPYRVDLSHNGSKALIRIYREGKAPSKPEIVTSSSGTKVRYQLRKWYLLQESDTKFELHEKTSNYSGSRKIYKCDAINKQP